MRLVYGVGVNDLDNTLTESGTQCKIYSKWKEILRRVYSVQVNDVRKNPTYVNATICSEWLLASNFRDWLTCQPNWEDKQIDKDILVSGNKHYSPETCVMLDIRTNTFLTDRRSNNRPFIGAYPKGKRFRSYVSNPFTGKRDCAGYFSTELEAHLAWKAKKHQHACKLAELQEDPRVAKALRERYAPETDWVSLK